MFVKLLVVVNVDVDDDDVGQPTWTKPLSSKPLIGWPCWCNSTQCWCYSCEEVAPCPLWGTGLSSIDHCNATASSWFWLKDKVGAFFIFPLRFYSRSSQNHACRVPPRLLELCSFFHSSNTDDLVSFKNSWLTQELGLPTRNGDLMLCLFWPVVTNSSWSPSSFEFGDGHHRAKTRELNMKYYVLVTDSHFETASSPVWVSPVYNTWCSHSMSEFPAGR